MSAEQELAEAAAFLKIRAAAAAAGIGAEGVSAFAARRNFIDFIQYTMPSYIPERFHRFLAAKLQAVVDGKIRRLIISAPPQRGKPVAHGTPVLMGDGRDAPIEQIRVGDEVMSDRGRPRKVTAVYEQGLLPTIGVGSMSGCFVYAAADHPFLTQFGFKDAGELQWGETLVKLNEHLRPTFDTLNRLTDGGVRPCRCLAVEDDHTFTADRLIVHNSQQTSKHLPAYWLAKRPNDPIILTSYGAELAEEHSEDARNIVLSQEYGELFPHIRLRGDTQAKKRWRLEGYRGGVVAAGVQGPIIGRGGMLGIIDDPFESWAAAQSRTIREGVYQWYRGTFRGRMWEGAAIILIMTRWHKEDLAGRLIADYPGDWEVIRVPALAETQKERDQLNEMVGLPKGLPDPIGREPGEPISPRRYSKKEEEQVKKDVGSEAHAAEYQGAPRSAEGNKFKEEWFEQNMVAPEDVPRRGMKYVRYWDKAGTDEAQAGPRTAFTVGVLMGKDSLGIYYVIDVARAQLSDLKRNLLILNTAKRDAAIYGGDVEVWVEQEPASGGKESAAISVRQLAAFDIHIDSVNDKGSKLVRARPYAAQMENNNVKIVRDVRSEMWVPTVGEDGQWLPHRWNKPFREEHTEYPNGLKDQVDAGSGGYAALTVYEIEQQEEGDALDAALGQIGGTW
jgi:hypothetical protein